MATLNNGEDEGDPMELNWGLHRGNTELGNENEGNVEDESDETILCVESEAMLRHLKDKSKLIDARFHVLV